MYVIDQELKEFLESGVALQVGTADLDGKPHGGSAWGPRVNEDGSMTIFLDTRRAGRPLANLAVNPRIAAVFAHPVLYRSVQLKGRWTATRAATAAETEWVERHRELFATNVILVGETPESVRNTWMTDVIRIDFVVDSAFDQTPGPNAGQPL